MKRIRQMISIMLISAIAFSMTACAGSNSDNVETEGKETGAWTISDQSNEAKLPDEVEKAFRKATESFTGSTLIPVAYIGSQVVSGKNHYILCKMTPSVKELNGSASYVFITVYENLEGKCEITDTKDYKLGI